MLAIAWTALNLLMSNFFITYDEVRDKAPSCEFPLILVVLVWGSI